MHSNRCELLVCVKLRLSRVIRWRLIYRIRLSIFLFVGSRRRSSRDVARSKLKYYSARGGKSMNISKLWKKNSWQQTEQTHKLEACSTSREWERRREKHLGKSCHRVWLIINLTWSLTHVTSFSILHSRSLTRFHTDERESYSVRSTANALRPSHNVPPFRLLHTHPMS